MVELTNVSPRIRTLKGSPTSRLGPWPNDRSP